MSEFAFLGQEPRVEPQRDGDDVDAALTGARASLADDGGDDDLPEAPDPPPPDPAALIDGLRALCDELHGDVLPSLQGAASADARQLGARARELHGNVHDLLAAARYAVQEGGGTEHADALSGIESLVQAQQPTVAAAIAAAPAPHPDDYRNVHASEAAELVADVAELPSDLRGRVEAASGSSLGDVRVHTGAAAASLTDAHDARAVAIGSDIHLGRGESVGDEWLLAHELAHTVQQSSGTPALAAKSRNADAVDTDPEREADAFAEAFVRGEPAPALTAAPHSPAAARKGHHGKPAHEAGGDAHEHKGGTVGGFHKAPRDQRLHAEPSHLDLSAEVGGSVRGTVVLHNQGDKPVTIQGVVQEVEKVGAVMRPVGDFKIAGAAAGIVVKPHGVAPPIVVTFQPQAQLDGDRERTTRRKAKVYVLDTNGDAIDVLTLEGVAHPKGRMARSKPAPAPDASGTTGYQDVPIVSETMREQSAVTNAQLEKTLRTRDHVHPIDIVGLNAQLDRSHDGIITDDERRDGLECTVWSDADWAKHMAWDTGGYGVDRVNEQYIRRVGASGHVESNELARDAAARGREEEARRDADGAKRVAAEKAARMKLPLEERVALYRQSVHDARDPGRQRLDRWTDYLSAAEWHQLVEDDPYLAKDLENDRAVEQHGDDWKHIRTSDTGVDQNYQPLASSTPDEYVKEYSTIGLETTYEEQGALPVQGAVMGPAGAFGENATVAYELWMGGTMAKSAYDECISDSRDVDQCAQLALATVGMGLAHKTLTGGVEEAPAGRRGGRTEPAPEPAAGGASEASAGAASDVVAASDAVAASDVGHAGARASTPSGAGATGGTGTASPVTTAVRVKTVENGEVIVDTNVARAIDKAARGEHLNASEQLSVDAMKDRGVVVTKETIAELDKKTLPDTTLQRAQMSGVDTADYEAAVAELTANRVGKTAPDREIVAQAVYAQTTGGTPAFATADGDIIRALFKMSGRSTARLGRYKNVAEWLHYVEGTNNFEVVIHGRALIVEPLQPVRSGL